MLDLGHARASNALPTPVVAYGNHKNVNKSKGPDLGPGLRVNELGRASPQSVQSLPGLFVLFGLLFRRSQAFEPL